MSEIFGNDELERFRKKQPVVTLEEAVAKGERLLDIEEAFKNIKEDHKTHDLLFEEFDEPNGFVLEIPCFGYMQKRKSGDKEPAFFSIEALGIENICLVASKSRDNSMCLGRLRGDYSSTSWGRDFEIYAPERALARKLTPGENQDILHPEKFASYILSQMNISATIKNSERDSELHKGRNWELSKKYWRDNPKYESALKGEDILALYKKGVLDALEVIGIVKGERANRFGHLDGGITFGLIENSHPQSKSRVKIANVSRKPLYLKYDGSNIESVNS